MECIERKMITSVLSFYFSLSDNKRVNLKKLRKAQLWSKSVSIDLILSPEPLVNDKDIIVEPIMPTAYCYFTN